MYPVHRIDFVRTERNYIYPRETERRDRTKVEAYFATRKISKETLDHFDVREDDSRLLLWKLLLAVRSEKPKH